MKIGFSLLLVTVAGLFFTIGRGTARNNQPIQTQTQKNLASAMHGESFAYAKYSLYAKQAEKNGNAELAKLFEATARTERFEHFAEEARIAGLVGSDADNLKDAIAGESYEVETMYPDFAKQAVAAGDKAAADRFEEIRRDEIKHRDAFKSALTKIGLKAIASR